MRTNIYKIGVYLSLLLLVTACRKVETIQVDVRDFNPDQFVPGDLDIWLNSEFVDPYNIEVVYRWKRELSPIGKDIVPPMLSKVKPAMEAVRDTWLLPYLEVAGEDFIKPLCPKQIVLFGSAEYNTNGTITLGTANGGRRVVLNVINTFDKANGPAVKRMMRTVHHEFSHIINQVVPIPTDYQEISRGGYFSNWTTEDDATARSLGFVSRYARLNPMEDFAEMTAHLLVEGQCWFENWVDQSPAAGATKLRLKEQAVVDYFYLNFGIDFRILQTRVQQALAEVTPPAPFIDGLINRSITNIVNINPYMHTDQSTAFKQVWDQAADNVFAIGSNAGRVLQDVYFLLGTGNDVTIRFNYHNAAGSMFNADTSMDMIIGDDGSVTFVGVPPRGTGTTWNNFNTVGNAVRPILNYLESHVFEVREVESDEACAPSLGGFFVKGNPTSFFVGVTE